MFLCHLRFRKNDVRSIIVSLKKSKNTFLVPKRNITKEKKSVKLTKRSKVNKHTKSSIYCSTFPIERSN